MAVGVPWDLGFPLPGVHYEKRLPDLNANPTLAALRGR